MGTGIIVSSHNPVTLQSPITVTQQACVGVNTDESASETAGPMASNICRPSHNHAAGLRPELSRSSACSPVGIPIKSDDPIIREATEARSRYWAAHGKLTELETKKATAQKRLEEDFGEDGALSALVDKCFEVRAAIHHFVAESGCPGDSGGFKDSCSEVTACTQHSAFKEAPSSEYRAQDTLYALVDKCLKVINDCIVLVFACCPAAACETLAPVEWTPMT